MSPYKQLEQLVEITRNYVNDEDFQKLSGPEQFEVIKSAYELITMQKGGPGSGRRSGPGTGRSNVKHASPEEMKKKVEAAKKKLKEAEAKGDTMEAIGIKNWLAKYDEK